MMPVVRIAGQKPANPSFECDAAKTARVFPDIIGAEAPNAGVKARNASILRYAQCNIAGGK